MPKFLVQEVYMVDATDQAEAEQAAKAQAKSGSVVHVANRLEAMFNPFHLAEAQEAFGHVQPEAEAASAPVAES